MPPVRLAIVGAGLIGRRHADHVAAEDCAELAAIVDPSDAARAFAEERGTAWHPSFAALLEHARPDGVIVATPNRLHVRNGIEAVAAGVPVLVEKPIADDVGEAERLVDAAARAGVPLLVGHHRRHNPLIREAKRAIETGRLGRIVSVQATCWFHKPASYFDAAWRRERGAGPVLVNLIHDIDLLRHLCGEVAAVQAVESNAVRGFAVEDTAAILLRFASGALGTMTVSDTVAAPWSWELTSGENPAYPTTPESCCLVGGTRGSLTLPHLDFWGHAGEPDWQAPINRVCLAVEAHDPLGLQVRNFAGVIRGTEAPVVSGQEGLATLKVVAAVKEAAATGRVVALA